MIVYADILVTVNIIVDYFLLNITAFILKRKIKTVRLIISSVLGGISSLYIFIPLNNVFFDMSFKAFTCLVMIFVLYGKSKIKTFIKAVITMTAITFLYGGIMIFLLKTFKPDRMIVNNFVVYFEVSPLVLAVTTIAFYIMFILLSKIFEKRCTNAKRCKVDIIVEDKTKTVTALIDTGNSASDVFGKSDIIIVDTKVKKSLFGNENKDTSEKLKRRFRYVPCTTVSGEDLLEGYRCDKAIVRNEDKVYELISPVMALCKQPLNDDYNAIINPEIFN